MKRISVLAVFAFLVGCQTPPPPMFEEHDSPAGHTFDYFHMPMTNAVSIHVHWVDAWSRDAANNQTVPLLGARLMMEGGAGDYDAVDIGELFEELGAGGSLNAVTDGVEATVVVARDDLDTIVPVLRDILYKPRFEERWIRRLSHNLQADYDSLMQSHGGNLSAMFYDHVVTNELLRESMLVWNAEDFTAVTSGELASWRASVFDYAPKHIAVTGNIDVASAQGVIDTLFGSRPQGAVLSEQDGAVTFTPGVVVWQDDSLENTVVSFAGEFPESIDGLAGQSLVIALQGFVSGEDAPLMKRVREELGATYGFNLQMSTVGVGNPWFGFSAEVDGQQLDEVRAVVRDAWSQYRVSGPDDDALTEMKVMAFGDQVSILREHPVAVAQGLLQARTSGGVPRQPEDVASGWLRVTPDSVREVLATMPSEDEWFESASTPMIDAWPDACRVAALDELSRCQSAY